jgi:hypothetical protein
MATLEITIKLTEAEVAEIDRAAKLERRTREDVLRLAAREYTRRCQRRRDNPDIQRAMAMIDAIAAKLGNGSNDSAAAIRYWRDVRR